MAESQTKIQTPKGAWRIAFLLLLYMLVNFADKIVVGLAGDPIMNELKLTNTDFGRLGASVSRSERGWPRVGGGAGHRC